MRFKIFGALVFFLIALPCHINTLFEDQVGNYDWRQQYLGKPISTFIHSNLNKIFVATEQNALACLNMKKGNILWRKVFESNSNGLIDHVVWGSKEIVLVTSEGQRVQAFDYEHGSALWEYNMFNKQQSELKYTAIESKFEADSYYISNGFQLCILNAREKICTDLPQEDGFKYKSIFEIEHGVFVIGYKDNYVKKLQYNSLLSSLISTVVSEQNFNVNFENCIDGSKDSNDLFCFSYENEKLVTGEVKSSNKFEFKDFVLKRSFLENNQKSTLIWASKEMFVVKSASPSGEHVHNLFIFKRQQDEKELVLLKKIDSVKTYDIFRKDNGISYLLYTDNSQSKSKKKFFTFDLNTGAESKDFTFTVNDQSKDKQELIQISARLGQVNGRQTLAIFCFYEDYSMAVFNDQGVRYFVREEALAYITSVEMIDFPLIHLQEEFEDEFGSNQDENLLIMFYKRIRTQLIQLKEFIAYDLIQKLKTYLNSGTLKRASTASSVSSNEEITRDDFNLNKLIVAVTSVGKVFGIFSGNDGRILWSFHLKNMVPFRVNKFKNVDTIPLFVQRTAAHVPYEPQCALVFKSLPGKTRVYFFNPLSGKPSKEYPEEGIVLDYGIKQAFLANVIDSHFAKPLILLDEENRLHVFPEKSIDDLKAKQNKPSIIYTTGEVNNKSNLLMGYWINFNEKPLEQMWSVNFEEETIIAIGSKIPNDRVHSHGKVLGDRSVLYKYLNPNLIGVVTNGVDSQKVPFINVYLVDTITGSVINSFNYKRCKGPVHIVHSENWFFFSYFNLKYRRFEVTSVELFEGGTQFNSTHFSSMDDIKPVVFSKTYIIQKSFNSMQITLTEKGISTKDIIVACKSGIIIEIPWILIDPRRPLKMTDVEREENLLPYMPEIPLNYEFSLNYYNYVYNVRGITTAPSGLESTSLVFAYGLDIFFTRVFPSKTFDMLREDFDYFFIITLMVGLLLGTLISKKLASLSVLKKAWK